MRPATCMSHLIYIFGKKYIVVSSFYVIFIVSLHVYRYNIINRPCVLGGGSSGLSSCMQPRRALSAGAPSPLVHFGPWRAGRGRTQSKLPGYGAAADSWSSGRSPYPGTTPPKLFQGAPWSAQGAPLPLPPINYVSIHNSGLGFPKHGNYFIIC